MRVLMTGHQGFIGLHLAAHLGAHGYRVRGHDRDDGDLAAPNQFLGALKCHEPDIVVHLAAQVGRLFGEDDLIHTVRSNTTMTALVAKYCGEHGIPVIYASTSEVYGDQGDTVCYEDSPLKLPGNLYGITKYAGEQVLRLYAPDGLKIVRLSMPYGPGAPPGRGRRAMDNFLWWAHHRQPITVHRGSERSWCHVRDTVEGIRLVMEKGKEVVYNVGRDDVPLSMLELAEKACDLTGAPYSLINEIDPPARQTVVKRLSTERLRQLGWRPKVELDQGILGVLDWVKRFDVNGKRLQLVEAA